MDETVSVKNNLIPLMSNKLIMGNITRSWKNIFTSNVTSDNGINIKLDQSNKLDKDGCISLLSDSNRNTGINLMCNQGGIHNESNIHTIKTLKYELNTKDIKLVSNNTFWLESQDFFLESNKIEIKNKNPNSSINISSIYGKIRLCGGSDRNDALELSALKGGLNIKTGSKGIIIDTQGEINLNSNKSIKIGTNNYNNNIFIGNNSGEVTVGNDLIVGGKIITNGEQRIEHLDSIRVETSEMLIELGKDNFSSLLDSGIIGNSGIDEQFGMYYHSMNKTFIFAEKMGINDNGIFEEPKKYGHLKAESIDLDNIKLYQGSLFLKNKLNLADKIMIDNNGNLETEGHIYSKRSLTVRSENGKGLYVEPSKNLTKVSGDLWLNKLHINALYQYQVGNSLLWKNIQDCIFSTNNQKINTIHIWNDKIYKEVIQLNNLGYILEGNNSILMGSIVINIDTSVSNSNYIIIKNLNIEASGSIPPLIIKSDINMKIILENVTIKNKTLTSINNMIDINCKQLKLKIINSKIKNYCSQILEQSLINSEGQINLKLENTKLRNVGLYNHSINISSFDSKCNNILDINKCIIDGKIIIHGNKLTMKESEWNVITEPHLYLTHMDSVILSSNKIINMDKTKSRNKWVEIENESNIVTFKFYGNRFLGLLEDYLLTVNNVKSYLISQGSTHINGFFANSYKTYKIEKNDILISSDHTFSDLHIGDPYLNSNYELTGKLENGKMMGQMKILLINQCNIRFYLQYNNDNLITILPDNSIISIKLVWNGKIWIQW